MNTSFIIIGSLLTLVIGLCFGEALPFSQSDVVLKNKLPEVYKDLVKKRSTADHEINESRYRDTTKRRRLHMLRKLMDKITGKRSHSAAFRKQDYDYVIDYNGPVYYVDM
ncbi:uncharacterized protein LOC143446708 [Clavelina lepadiformis]|uniref:uncharacterized protein LOC143446708 n=1 Tax=Clavelina lepadiformis TaxID=159417 RepID=UPI004041E24F